jgi:radical SAM superfamily enzyme YgiQ (UPF0313 family)
MKVTLINPSYFLSGEAEKRKHKFRDVIKGGNMYFYPFEPPLGLASLYSFLSEKGHDVNLVDIPGESISNSKLAKKIMGSGADIIGITAMTPTINTALDIAKLSKSVLSQTPVIIGGVHPTVSPEFVLSSEYVDFVIRGEGEISFNRFLEKGLKAPDEIPGLCWKKNGDIVIQEKAPPIQNLEEIPRPDYHSFPVEKYIEYTNELRGIRAISMMISRGCPYNCSFCAVHQTMGKKWRCCAPRQSAEFMMKICKDFNLEGVWFKDSIFNINHQWTQTFANYLISLNNPYKFQFNTRVDLINPDEICLLKKAGLTKVDLGIESGSKNSLKTLNKGISIEQIHYAVNILRKAEIKVSGFFMIGIPGETENDIMKTFSLSRELKLDSASFSIFTPLPGSELYTELCNDYVDHSDNRLIYHHFTESNTSYCKVSTIRLKTLFTEINDFFGSKEN